MGERYDPMAAYLANGVLEEFRKMTNEWLKFQKELFKYCLLYTSDAADE